jgi:type II secretory pathway pseudopilin PulG
LVAEMPFLQFQLPAVAAIGAVVVIGYLLSRARHGRWHLTLMDLLILVALVAIAGAAGLPVVEAVNTQAKKSVLRENLHSLRSQIQFYALQHRGQLPVLSQASLPQLIRATDIAGSPGEPSSKRPFGPYLKWGVPVNPLTGRSIVTATDVFPPTKPSGNGGWLYHQPSGSIAVDLKDFLNE